MSITAVADAAAAVPIAVGVGISTVMDPWFMVAWSIAAEEKLCVERRGWVYV